VVPPTVVAVKFCSTQVAIWLALLVVDRHHDLDG